MQKVQKKGDIFEGLLFIIMLFFLAVGFLIMSMIFTNIASSLNNDPLNSTAGGQAAIAQLQDIGTNGLQRGYLFLFAGLIIAMMISAFFIKTSPIFAFIYVIATAVNIIFAVYFSNSYQLLMNSGLESYYIQNGIIRFIMENLVRISLIASALSMVLMFARLFGGDGGGNV